MNIQHVFSVIVIVLMTVNVCFGANYADRCSSDQHEEQQCGETETCCSRTITTIDKEDSEIISEISSGCCPYHDGVCCADADGCCPNGYTCDSANRKCLKESKPVTQPHVLCGDGSSCTTGQSCCPLSSSSQPSYGCCPYSNGVCCLYPVGCCPAGYSCTSTGNCRSYLGEEIPMSNQPQDDSLQTRSVDEEVEMLTLNKREWDGTYTTCPNGSKCLKGHTCCKLDDSSRLTTPYACCPYYQAICCKDSSYCCPSNKPCDPTTNECVTKPTKRDAPEERMPAFRMD